MSIAIILSVFFGGSLTLLAVSFARWRVINARFFTSMLDTIQAEDKMIANILHDPYLFYWYSMLDEKFFSSKLLTSAYLELVQYFKSVTWYPNPEGFNSFKEASLWLKGVRETFEIDPNLVSNIFSKHATNLGLAMPSPTPSNDNDNSEINQILLYGLENKKDRNMLSSIVKEDSGEIYRYKRIMKDYPKSLYFLTFLICSMGFFSFHQLSILKYPDSTQFTKFLILSTLSLLMFSSIAWAIVDIYTMYLDYDFFKISNFCSALILLLSLFSLEGSLDEKTELLLKTLAVPIGILIFLQTILFIFKRIKGIEGMGLGDFYIIFPVTLIPLLYVNDFKFAFHSFMLSNILGILGWLILRAQGKLTSTKDPFAFGPYLATGWVITLFLYVAFNLL